MCCNPPNRPSSNPLLGASFVPDEPGQSLVARGAPRVGYELRLNLHSVARKLADDMTVVVWERPLRIGKELSRCTWDCLKICWQFPFKTVDSLSAGSSAAENSLGG